MIFGSKQYSWSDLSVAIAGRIITGITEVEYTQKQDKEALMGRGNDPHDLLAGNNSYEGKITLWQSEVESLVQSAPGKNVLNLRFDLIVSYVAEEGGPVVTDVLQTCGITELKKSMKQGDKNMLIDLPFVFCKIKPQQ
jgi:hypothetical protein